MPFPDPTPLSMPALTDGPIRCIHVASDGGVLIGGRFDQVQGVKRRNIARLLPDGRPDPGFAPAARNMGPVLVMVQDGHGRLAAGGWGSAQASAFAWFAPDGKRRPGSDGVPSDVAYVSALAWAPDGHLLLGSKQAEGDGRLMVLDPGGVPVPFSNGERIFTCDDPGIGATVRAIRCQDDGMVLVGGRFDACHAVRCPGMVRMDLDGHVDAGFHAELEQGGMVLGIHPLADGSLIVHVFIGPAGDRCHRLFRLHPDGRLDTKFPVQAFLEGEVTCVSVADDVLHIAEAVQTRSGRVHSRIRCCAPASAGVPVLLAVVEGLVWAMAPAPAGGILVATDHRRENGQGGHGLVHVRTPDLMARA